MDILSEIIEVSENMVDTLIKTEFFEEHPFINPNDYKKELQKTMQRKWEQENEMYLNDEEFLEICKNVHSKGISSTIEELVDKGALDMSISETGEILYSANKDFNIDDL